MTPYAYHTTTSNPAPKHSNARNPAPQQLLAAATTGDSRKQPAAATQTEDCRPAINTKKPHSRPKQKTTTIN